MRPLIDKHNYEAYYLDYLEGNLDAETSELLEMFLAEHPELSVDGEFPQLEPDVHIDPSFHLSLKREATEEITAKNLDYFLIAELEGQLSSAERAKLNAFLLLHPELEKERRVVQSLVLQSGNEQYAYKESLKKGARIIPLWAKMAAAAAVLLLFTLPFIRFSENGLNPQSQTAGVNNRPSGTAPNQPSADSSNDSTAKISPSANQVRKTEYIARQNASSAGSGKRTNHNPSSGLPQKQQKQDAPVSGLPVKTIGPSVPELAVAQQEKATNTAVASADVAHESRMENPIPAITRGVSEVFNTPVDVKTEKSASKKGRGFYIRVGNVEVSRSASL